MLHRALPPRSQARWEKISCWLSKFWIILLSKIIKTGKCLLKFWESFYETSCSSDYCTHEAIYKTHNKTTVIKMYSQLHKNKSNRRRQVLAQYQQQQRVGCRTSLRCRWQTRATQYLRPTVLYTDVGGQCDKLVTDTVTSLPHWSST